MLLEIFFFLFVVLFAFYLPGRWLLRITAFPLKDMLTAVVLSLGVGVAAFMTFTYALSWVHAGYIYSILLVLVSITEIGFSFREYEQKFLVRQLFSMPSFLIVLGSCCMVFLTALSGIVTKGQMQFSGVNGVDAIYHISLMNSMLQHFPPSNPSIGGVALHGYHILYDFLLAQLVGLYGFNKFDIFFRLFPAFMTVFYGLAGLSLVRYLNFDKMQQSIFLFLLYFAQGSQVLLMSVLPGSYDQGIIQSLGHIFDPSVVLSMGILFVFLPSLFSAKRPQHYLIVALLLGVLGGLKVYTAILGFAGLGAIAIMQIIQERKFSYLTTLIVAGCIGGGFFIPFNLGVGKLIFAPLLLYRHFMESNQIFAFLSWPLKLQVYEQHRSWIRIGQLYAEALLLFFLPSLGIRLLSLMGMSKILRRSFYTYANVFFFTTILVGLILGSLFIQNIEVFNTIQFLWLTYILLIVPTAFMLGQLALKSKIATVIVLILIAAMTLPDTYSLMLSYTKPTIILSQDFLAAMEKIEANTNLTDGIIVINRIHKGDVYNTTFFSAISNRPIYYQSLVVSNVNEELVTHRKSVVDRLYTLSHSCNNEEVNSLLQKEKLQYVLTLEDTSCFDQDVLLHKVSQYGSYHLYKTI